jgi:ferredoxin
VKASVDDERCRGHGICELACPEVFTLTDDGYAEAREGELPARTEAGVKTAAGSCPERAITVT